MAKYIDASAVIAEIERLEEEARKIRISREVTTNQAIGADGQVKLCSKIKDFTNSLPESKQRGRFEQPNCTITHKECRNLRIVKDQYGVKYGHCMKADCYLWDVEECSDEKPIKKGGK